MAYISRDPFAREELHREREYRDNVTCLWCGNVRQTGTGRKYLYRYHIETDSGRTFDINGLFDGVECMRAYHS